MSSSSAVITLPSRSSSGTPTPSVKSHGVLESIAVPEYPRRAVEQLHAVLRASKRGYHSVASSARTTSSTCFSCIFVSCSMMMSGDPSVTTAPRGSRPPPLPRRARIPLTFHDKSRRVGPGAAGAAAREGAPGGRSNTRGGGFLARAAGLPAPCAVRAPPAPWEVAGAPPARCEDILSTRSGLLPDTLSPSDLAKSRSSALVSPLSCPSAWRCLTVSPASAPPRAPPGAAAAGGVQDLMARGPTQSTRGLQSRVPLQPIHPRVLGADSARAVALPPTPRLPRRAALGIAMPSVLLNAHAARTRTGRRPVYRGR
mmetsp:Transcript_37122/g.116801  ORF Transcript_37122/g.116801 Transcript_37122/m.116801 type:complete len:313 (-) Transcript_37122:13-951(-)